MSDFVEECRREWKRLGVADEPAREMADDLTADLREAEADGAFPEEVLGDGADDPRAFAAAWARERGLVRPRSAHRSPIRPAVIGGAVVVALAIAGAAIVATLVAGHDSSSPAAVTVPAAPVVGKVHGTSILVHAAITGTSIVGATLLPAGTRLRAAVAVKHPLSRRPTAITAAVSNSGMAPIAKVTVLVQVGRQNFTRTITRLPVNHVREVTVPLPARLPSHFTIRVSTLPVSGERNTSNNSAAWKLSLRP